MTTMHLNLRLLTSLLLFIAASSVDASDTNHEPWRLSLLATELGNISDPYTNSESAGHAIAIAYSPEETWDVELSAGSKSYRSPYTVIVPTGFPPPSHFAVATTWRSYTVHPLELTVTRRFTTQSRLSPYVRAGVRYVDAPESPATPWAHLPGPGLPFSLGYHFDNRQSLQAGAGVYVRLGRRTALRAEVMRLVRDDAVPFDPLTRASVGMSWNF